MIAPMVRMQMSEEKFSNHQSLADFPIQITSIEVDVKTNPNQTQNAHTIPFHAPEPPIIGDVEAAFDLIESDLRKETSNK